MDVYQQIEGFESRRCAAYQDTEGVWTIGVGHTGPEVVPGLVWNDDQCDFAFQLDVGHAITSCQDHFDPWFDALNDPRQAVLIGMVFQLGLTGVLGFRQTLADIRDQRYANAAEQMRQSKWDTQTPRRVAALATQMETGEWQAS